MRKLRVESWASPAVRTIVTHALWTYGSCLPYIIGSAGNRSPYAKHGKYAVFQALWLYSWPRLAV